MSARDSRALDLQKMKLLEKKQRIEQRLIESREKAKRLEGDLENLKLSRRRTQQRLELHQPNQDTGRLDARSMSAFRIERAGLSAKLVQLDNRVSERTGELLGAQQRKAEIRNELMQVERDIEVVGRAMEKRAARARLEQRRKLDEPEI